MGEVGAQKSRKGTTYAQGRREEKAKEKYIAETTSDHMVPYWAVPKDFPNAYSRHYKYKLKLL